MDLHFYRARSVLSPPSQPRLLSWPATLILFRPVLSPSPSPA